jgi:hypothetical protein
MKIEVGMLVRIIASKYMEDGTSNSIASKKYIGMITRVIKKAKPYNGLPLWFVENTTEYGMAFPEVELEPINPDSEPADEDFQEDLKRWLGKKVTA